MIAERPGSVDVPPAVAALAEGASLTPVWRNEVGGLTFSWPHPTGRRFVKWTPAGSGIDLAQEVSRLGWASRYTAVPQVLARGGDATGTWIVTAGLPGDTAVADRWVVDPEPAVRAIGIGLRALHDRLPVDACPFSWTAEHRLVQVRRDADEGRIDPARWNDDHAGLGVEAALARVSHVPPVDRLVVCHGDACAPNTLVDDGGRWTGHVDLGCLGVGDRWSDLAVATWSLSWNFGPGWEDTLLAAYGVGPDPGRTAYYRLLWDLG